MNNIKIVLICGGLNDIAKQFHSFPAEPIGIIELHSNDLESRVEKITRKFIALLRFNKFSSLEEYAAHHQLHYAAIFKRDVNSLKNTLTQWDANLAITSYCPVIPMEAVKDLSHGAINLHPSLLPDYRGGNPLFWQVHDQVKHTGVTVHHLQQTVDSGPIIGQLSVERQAFVSKQRLTKLTEGDLGTRLLKQTVQSIQAGTSENAEQPHRSNTRYAGNFRASTLAKHVDLQNIDLTTLYDIACFYGEWPPEIGHYAGWRKLCKWVPSRPTEVAPDTTVINGSLQVDRFFIRLLHVHGHITLRPKLSIKHIIKGIISLIKAPA